MTSRHLLRTALASLALVSTLAFAVDNEPSAGAGGDPLADARAKIMAKDYIGAIKELERVDDRASADWHNLMGYSQRKQPKPDLDSAERHYNEALRIDPRHRWALEYAGELHLMKGDLAGAEKRLAALDKICTFGCEQYTDLKKAIARFKAAGNKYVATTP